MKNMIYVLLIIFFNSACVTNDKKEVEHSQVEDQSQKELNETVDTLETEEAIAPFNDKANEAKGEEKSINEKSKLREETKDEPKKSVPKPVKVKTEKVEKVVKSGKGSEEKVRMPKPEPVAKEGKLEQVKRDNPNEMVRSPAGDHSQFDALLSKHVSDSGNVNYKAFKTDENKLDAYLKSLETTEVLKLSRNERLAFWINAYNAFTLKLILKNYPVNQITQLDDGKPWDTKWIKINGKTLSLNNIENDIIRPQFKEPRIHFAVNCAAKSCPPLLNKAWTSNNLESLFEKQTSKFINNSTFNSISANNIKISKIFEWYSEDFGDLIGFLNRYSKTKVTSDASVNYIDYNWDLNQ